MKEIDNRSSLLITEEATNYLKNKKVAIFGLGGVGSIVPISLARSGILNLLIVDFDKVSESNLNRQLAYTSLDVGKSKSEVTKNLLNNIRDDLNVISLNSKVDENFDYSILDSYDYVIDCIDDLKGKILLIKYCLQNNIRIISSLGMGNRLDPSKVIITKLNKTTDDPLARKLRYELKKENVDISKLDVSFSLEKPIINSRVISSMVFVPNASGLLMASFVLKYFIKEYEYEVRDN